MTNPVFLWTLGNAAESVSVLLWSKVVILIDGPRVTRVTGLDVYPTEDLAREAALSITTTCENLGIWLTEIYGHPGWYTLPEQIANAHRLHAEGREKYALATVVEGIATRIVRDGEWLHA